MNQQLSAPQSFRRTAEPARPRRWKGRAIALSAVTIGAVLAAALVFLTRADQHPATPDSQPLNTAATPSDPPPSSPSVTTALPPSRPMLGGWYAGASGLGVANGTFQRWLSQPVTVAATWADQSDSAQRTLPTLRTEYKNWKGALDIAVGGTVLGSRENYASAARGAYDKRWRAAAKTLADRRKAATGPTFVRPFHEMNGDWYQNWVVTKSNSADYKKAFARYVKILRTVMPDVYISWSPNYGDRTGLRVEYWYPGDAVVDCVAPDYYDDGATPARVDARAWNSEADDTDTIGNPVGPEAWRQFALTHGKPVCFPEWGLKPEGAGVDHPVWIKAFNTWMNSHANTATWTLGEPIPAQAAGKVLYSAYFNVAHRGDPRFTIHGMGANPRSAAAYRKLTWGSRNGQE